MAQKKKKKKKNPPSQINNKAAAAKSKKPVAETQDAPEKIDAPPKKTVAAKKKSVPAPKKKGLSATAQWALIGLVGAVILGVFVLLPAITDAADDGGPGNVTTAAFDLPVLDDQDLSLIHI